MTEENPLDKFTSFFFVGIAGAGMSAVAQYLVGCGHSVSGSDRFFSANETNETRSKLEAEGIKCFEQNGSGIDSNISLVIVSAAVEETVAEVQKARSLNIPVIQRSDLLAMIADTKKTIAVGGTSGKSSVTGMLFQILKEAGYGPSIISGAGLVSIIREGKIGNAFSGKGEYLIIEADESDGSIVKYHPQTGLLLNIDKDHSEISELEEIFTKFRANTTGDFIVNRSNTYSKKLSAESPFDFSSDENPAPYHATDFSQTGMTTEFKINEVVFRLNAIGRHSMSNALAAAAVAASAGVDLESSARALANYEGIYRRHQMLGVKTGITVIDDYAHNPAKCAASIRACQPLSEKVIAWFQPHGYGPTRFLKNDFVAEISASLREQDEIWMSEIYYAGGTAEKNISAKELIDEITLRGKNAFFIEDRNQLLSYMRSHFIDNSVVLLMGARDPGLELFGKQFFEEL